MPLQQPVKQRVISGLFVGCPPWGIVPSFAQLPVSRRSHGWLSVARVEFDFASSVTPLTPRWRQPAPQSGIAHKYLAAWRARVGNMRSARQHVHRRFAEL